LLNSISDTVSPPEFEEVAQGITPEQARVTLAERFIVPPFSVLDARQGYWQERKRAWLALGIKGELGRGGTSNPGSQGDTRSGRDAGEYVGGNAWKNSNRIKGKLPAAIGGQPLPLDRIKGKEPATSYSSQAALSAFQKTGNPAPKAIQTQSWIASVKGEDFTGLSANQTGTSIFDPVLCELAYRWFCPPDGTILDPFAGGSVRGIVAHKLDRQYTGIDLRAEQTAANEAQASEILTDGAPTWITGDAKDVAALAPGEYDFVFTCPPYGDLEIYSELDSDLSNMEHADFIAAYKNIIAGCVGMLKADRFACIVVGDFRDKKGMYRNFVSDTIAAFQNAGAMLYNEAILVTAVGSLPIRAGKQFDAARKLGKTHQNVLVFVRGDPRKATEAIGKVEAHWPEAEPTRADGTE